MSKHLRVSASLLALSLAACSGGPSTSPLPASAGVSDASRAPVAGGFERRKATLHVSIRIPRKHKRARGPRYISAATKGMTMAFTGPSTFVQAVNLTPSDPRCSGSPLVCNVSVALAAGGYTAAIATYDQAPVNGAIPAGAGLLSSAKNLAFSVSLGTSNHVGVTLDGVPASFAITGLPGGAAGTSFGPASFTVNVKDADGYSIVGTYANPVTLSDGDHSGATELATAGADNPPAGELLSSSDTATLSYTGKLISFATITATATGAATGTAIFAPLVPVYVADYAGDTVKEIPPGCFTDVCVSTLGGGFLSPVDVAVDGSGNVFVGDSGNNAVKEIPLGCTAAGCVTTLGGGFSMPYGVAVDASGNVFVSDLGHGKVDEIPSGCTNANCVTTLGGGFVNPNGIAVDASDHVFVVDGGAVKEIPPGCITAGCVTAIGGDGAFLFPLTGVALDGSGDVFVTDIGNASVKEVPAGCAAAGCVTTLGGGFNEPYGVAADGAGNVFVADENNAEVYEIPPGCVSAGCVTTLGGGFSSPTGVATP
jgi:hypothetical protein